jgi:hypothetical protein
MWQDGQCMKFKHYYFVLGMFLASSIFAGQPLTCENPVKDFGTIEEGGKFSHTFIIKNISAEIVEVNKTISSCGCVVTSKKEFKLKPNESTDIGVEFDSSGVGGMKIWKTIAVCPKDDKDKPLVLTVKADVKGIPPEKSITIEPRQKTMDGSPDKKYTLRLQVPSDPNINFSIDAPQWLSYSLQKSRYNNSAGVVVNWDIEIYLKTKQRAKLSGDIIVNSNLPRFEKVMVPIKVEPQPAFIINPYMITFDGSNPNQSKEVLIKLNDDTLESTRHLLEIKSSKECLETIWTNNENLIHLKVTNKSCGEGFGKIEIKVGDQVLGVIPVIFRGNG